MTLPFDHPQLIGVFAAETKEHLENLNKGILTLEKKQENADLVHELMREAHNLKGAAGTLGFTEIKEISHRIEDVLIAVRDRRLQFDSSAADKIFSGLDAIKELLEGIVDGKANKIDLSALLRKITVDFDSSQKKEKQEDPSEKAQDDSPAPDEEDQEGTDQQHSASSVEEFVRVPLSRINKLLNLGGELVINKIKSTQKIRTFKRSLKVAKELQARLSHLSEQIKQIDTPKVPSDLLETLHHCNGAAERIKEEILTMSEEILRGGTHIDPIVDELQEQLKHVRMLPCSTLFMGFPRLVRDLALTQGKEVELRMEGEETELDKKVLEEIKEPLMHILRNAVDHGIEPLEERVAQGKPRTATIRLTALQRGANVIVEIRDDGRGVDAERIKEIVLAKGLGKPNDIERMSEKELLSFVFKTGFSTSRFITDVSGRGIGMDVVKSRVEKLKGRVDLTSEKGKGTVIIMEIPLTIAIIHVLLVKEQEKTFAIPLGAVDEVAKVPTSEIRSVENKMAFQLRGHIVPIVKLYETLGMPSISHSKKPKETVTNVIIISSLNERVGFIVDGLLGKEEIYFKNLGPHLGRLRNVSGGTVLGTGEVIVILDPADLVQSSKASASFVSSQQKTMTIEKRKRKILAVEDSLTTREVLRSILESEGYSVDTAIDGFDALEKISQITYDLIVSDIEMPRMNGLELCRTLKTNETYQDIPIVFVTAHATEEEKKRGIEVGAQAYIVKSHFDQGNLLIAIDRLIA